MLSIAADKSNFDFLDTHDTQLTRLGLLAEHFFKLDPNTCLLKLGQFGELLAQICAAKTGQYRDEREDQADLLRRLKFGGFVPPDIAELFHRVRLLRNKATHARTGNHSEALTALKIARQLAIWFERTFGNDPNFNPGQFVPPPDPAAASAALQEELASLRKKLDDSRTEAERVRLMALEAERLRLSAEELARREHEERTIWEQLASEADQARAALTAQLASLQTVTVRTPQREIDQIVSKAKQAATKVELDEAVTRSIIDEQLRVAGWEVDSQTLRYAAGTRPAKNHNMAIAEWPTASGPADYALFVGTQCIGVIEAKRQRINISGAIDQAERYAKGFQFGAEAEAISGPWTADGYRVPFVFASNGRPYLRQLETESGIWFRDVRKPTNLRRALAGWLTPDGLRSMLQLDITEAQATLTATPINFAFPLRPYQRKAIERVEAALADERRRTILLAMATGTGKTKLAIALLYRLLEAKRFRRVCFVVDRSTLGEQAASEFNSTQIVTAKTFADIFGLKGLADVWPDPDTRVHICTIQGLVKRVLYNNDPTQLPPVDQYDLMVVDECHRGYLLDREMSDAELGFRDQADYISKYRQVLEYFDATKIGLTATPALHTVEIFGDPIFTYSYREAVIDGFLVDHEPPVQITTALSQAGIVFQAGEEIELLDTHTGQLDLTRVPDEVRFEVDAFNKKVITVEFNRVVAEELARHIDPNLPGKTLIFATSDRHADIVVNEIKTAFAAAYGQIEDGDVRKITGYVDNAEGLIRAYRNDSQPKIAVTVDLLTTGVDVPKIENLVFLRRVNSRILYEQMLGRATRLCPEIGKEVFHIFDAVDLYSKLQNLTTMQPVVVNPNIKLNQLFEELGRVDVAQTEQLATIRDQLVVKLRRLQPKLSPDAQQQFQQAAGETFEATLTRLMSEPLPDVAAWVSARPQMVALLTREAANANANSVDTRLVVSHHLDEVIGVTHGYGSGMQPDDFLDNFGAFVRDNVNKIAALTVVVQRPRDLTSAELRQLRLELDQLGYSDMALRSAWHDVRNADIAASIIGFVRQAALGDPLIPYPERVGAAIRRISARRALTRIQQDWLRKIGEQIEKQIVIDKSAFDREPFSTDGGFNRFNRVFNGELETVLADINEELWKNVS